MSAIVYLYRSIDVTVLNDSVCRYVGMLCMSTLAIARTQGLFIEKIVSWSHSLFDVDIG